jgi:uncharacterized circularly permuted ATP-grasp superfamily protein
VGITFAVYGEGGDPERLIPFDVIPRILARSEWDRLSRGLTQRVKALNAFIGDIYTGGEIVRAGKVPQALISENEAFCQAMVGFTPPAGVFTHISGIDLVRTGPDDFYVLEDNCRTPSGVSYMLENREAMLRLFPGLCSDHRLAPVGHYPEELLETLKEAAPPNCRGTPRVAILTPGHYNSAYYEHCFLADEMGVEVVEGADLFVEDDIVYMRTTAGPQRVDVLYRRVDDDYLDPRVFKPESMLGVPGIFAAYRAGNVTLANAPGAGIADDKAIYPFVTEDDPLLPGRGAAAAERADLSLRAGRGPRLRAGQHREAGGEAGARLGRLRHAGRAACDDGAAGGVRGAHQGTARTTTSPSRRSPFPPCRRLREAGIAPRHVDLRPYVLMGKEVRIVPGGLTRVALREGSLVVNSSQGGGTKDTWVVDDISATMSQSQTMGGMTQSQRMG